MRRTIRPGLRDFDILDIDEPATDREPLKFEDRLAAVRFLGRLQRDAQVMRVLREFVGQRARLQGYAALDDSAVLEQLAGRLVSGRVRIVPRAEKVPLASAPAPEVPKPAVPDLSRPAPQPVTKPPPKKTKTFVKFCLLDDRTNKPVRDVPLQVTLPDGTRHRQRTDVNGIVEFSNIDPGSCKLERVDDQQALEVVGLKSGGA